MSYRSVMYPDLKIGVQDIMNLQLDGKMLRKALIILLLVFVKNLVIK
jgi:hypothetical protein